MSVSFKRIKTHLELDDKITFGIHSGQTISYMLQFEPEYLLWATKQPGLLTIAPALLAEAEKNALRAKLEKAERNAFKLEAYQPSKLDPDWDIDVPF